jgi:hypothetical protein
MMATEYKDISEIRRMIAVGNRFNVTLEMRSRNEYRLVFNVVNGSQFVLSTQKRNDRELKEKIFSTSDAALLEIHRLAKNNQLKNLINQVTVSFNHSQT